jgi:phosphate starvation-inducible PhoH-like protein
MLLFLLTTCCVVVVCKYSICVATDLTSSENQLSKRKSGALRKEQEFMTSYQKQSQTFYQKHDSNTINFNPQKQRKSISLIPKSVNQEKYILALQDAATDVVVASGPAGTGKTYISTLAAIQAYRNKEVDRIVICRPAVTIEDEQHGFLPGDLTAKLAPWVRPVLDVFREYYAVKEIEHMIAEEIIEFVPLGMMRGRSLKNTYLLLDEAQNSSPLQLKSLLTRIGEGCKFVINGDINQTDRLDKECGLADLMFRLKKNPIAGVEVCEFNQRDIQRHRLVGEFIDLYN